MNRATVAMHLDRTSRTFALALPLLPPPLDREASLAYLLFRTIDTLEDGTRWTSREKVDALVAIERWLASPGRLRCDAELMSGRWIGHPPANDRDAMALLAALPELGEAIHDLDAGTSALIRSHARRTAAGMRGYLSRSETGVLTIRDIEDLRGYCYVVAGVVGELLTELFLSRSERVPPATARDLRSLAPFFGEGLQLVNVLRDEVADAAVGRRLVPAGQHGPAAELAARDLDFARGYVEALRRLNPGRDPGPAPFAEFLVRLADGTLGAVRREGPGARLPRSEVFRAIRELRGSRSAVDPETSNPAYR